MAQPLHSAAAHVPLEDRVRFVPHSDLPSLKIDRDTQVVLRPATDTVQSRTRYAFDSGTKVAQREQMVRVEQEKNATNLWRVWFSAIYLGDKQRFSLRGLPHSYDVTLSKDLDESVWLRDGASNELITTEILTDGKVVLEAAAYVDRSHCRTYSFDRAEQRRRELMQNDFLYSKLRDDQRVIYDLCTLANLKSSQGFQAAYEFVSRSHGRVLALFALQTGTSVPLALRSNSVDKYVHPVFEEQNRYILPGLERKNGSLTSRDVFIETDGIPIAKSTAPGRNPVHAFTHRQLGLVLTGYEPRYTYDKSLAICRHHNRRLA
jgi:hypothetical protein